MKRLIKLQFFLHFQYGEDLIPFLLKVLSSLPYAKWIDDGQFNRFESKWSLKTLNFLSCMSVTGVSQRLQHGTSFLSFYHIVAFSCNKVKIANPWLRNWRKVSTVSVVFCLTLDCICHLAAFSVFLFFFPFQIISADVFTFSKLLWRIFMVFKSFLSIWVWRACSSSEL